MAVKFFGQYLLERGAVTTDLLLKAIALQDSINLKLGETALAIKMITPSDVKRIHDAQRTEDLMFGDMAVKLGILTEGQLGEILDHQQRTHLRIGEALVRVGAFDHDQLNLHLEGFRADQAKYATTRTLIPAGIAHPEIWEISADLTAKMFVRMVGLQCHLGDCTLVERVPGGALIAGIDLNGDVSARYLLGVSDELRAKIACSILMESDVSDEPEEVLDDTVLEYVNIVCGNVAAKAAPAGTVVDIEPPFCLRPGEEGIPVPADCYGLHFQLVMATGESASLTLFVKR